MKKLLLINSVLGYGSTGRIVLNIAKEYEQNGYEVKIAYGRKTGIMFDEGKQYGVRIGTDLDVYWHAVYCRLTDKHGLASKMATKKFIRWAEDYDPDILWLHNIHGYYINYELLFRWIKSRSNMKVKWTLHDCWTITGHCSHFTFAECEKWQKECHDCPQLDQYPKSIVDNSRSNHIRKREAFTGVQNLTIITPSEWLKGILYKSYLAEYPIEVVYNRVNTEIFMPTPSCFKKDYGIHNLKMILGVASVWNERKGINDFIELSKKIDPSEYKIVLVGLSADQIKELSSSAPNILGLPRTSNAKELAQIYTAADVFVNPTYEDTFPSVNMEAESCGTPVIVYNTGGCSETIHGEKSIVVDKSVYSVYEAIIHLLG